MRRKRMSEDALMTELATRAGVSCSEASKVWNAFRGFVRDGVNGNPDLRLYVPGLGTFARATHRGHPLNLNIKGSSDRIGDYEVVRFKADDEFKSMVLEQQSVQQ